MENKTSLRFQLSPVTMVRNIKPDDSSCWSENEERRTLVHCWSEFKLVQLQGQFVSLRKLGIDLPQDPVIPLLITNPQQSDILLQRYFSTMFIADLLIITKLETAKMPFKKKLIVKMWSTNTMEIFLQLKKGISWICR